MLNLLLSSYLCLFIFQIPCRQAVYDIRYWNIFREYDHPRLPREVIPNGTRGRSIPSPIRYVEVGIHPSLTLHSYMPLQMLGNVYDLYYWKAALKDASGVEDKDTFRQLFVLVLLYCPVRNRQGSSPCK